MIYVICGLIGAGKTTFAKNNFSIVTDYDDIGSKEVQLEIARQLWRKGRDFAHITCYPTPRERMFFKSKGPDVVYIWVDTDYETALDRVRERGRERDILNMDGVKRANKEYLEKLRRTSLNFIRVDSGEKLISVTG